MKPKIDIESVVKTAVIEFLKEYGTNMHYGKPEAELFWLDNYSSEGSMHVDEFWLDDCGVLHFSETDENKYEWLWEDIEDSNYCQLHNDIYELAERLRENGN